MGKTWLQQAVDAEGGAAAFNLTVTRSPFFLYPGGRHPITRWGERVDALYHPTASRGLAALGSSAGYSFDMSAELSDTLDSHRLVLWAQRQRQGSGEELAHAVGKRYFEGAVPLADRSMLLESVREVGLDSDEARAYLESDAGHAEVAEAVDWAHRGDIHSIPLFVFSSGGFSETVHGSADVRRFSSVLRAIREHWAREPPASPPVCQSP